MISEASSSCFQHNPQAFHMYGAMDDMLSSSVSASDASTVVSAGAEAHCSTLLSCLSVLRDKVQHVESVVGMVVSSGHVQHDSVSMVVAGAGALIQEIIVAASSMMFAFQQLALDTAVMVPGTADELSQQHHMKLPNNESPSHRSGGTINQVVHDPTEAVQGGYFKGQPQEGYSIRITTINTSNVDRDQKKARGLHHEGRVCEIVELDAADLLAKYTHYCQVCGKGFKRDANLRMHMRAHGDEYKTSAALSNPSKSCGAGDHDHYAESSPRKYSCPQEGCRWNRRHPKFQPLKSMICVKNHYRRSHCPKMYVCNRCHRKQFSVLSDLRTHEKHCGDLRWRCTCGTTFSRKDKLMGHVALFVGHAPAVSCPSRQGNAGVHALQRTVDGT